MNDNKIIRYDTQTGEPIYVNDKRAYYNAEMDEINNKMKEKFYYSFFSFIIAVVLLLAYGKIFSFNFLSNVLGIGVIVVSLAFLYSSVFYISVGSELLKQLKQMEIERRSQIGDIDSYIVNADNVAAGRYMILSSEEIEKNVKKIVKNDIVVSIVILVSMALLIVKSLFKGEGFNYLIAIIFLVALLVYLVRNHFIIDKIKKNRFFLRPVVIKQDTNEDDSENSAISINQGNVPTKNAPNYVAMAVFLVILGFSVIMLKDAGGLFNEAKNAEDGESMFIFILEILPILPVLLIIGSASILGVFVSFFKKK